MNDLMNGVRNAVDPKRVVRELLDFKPGEFTLIGAMLLAQIISFIFAGSYTAADWIGLISGICIVFNLILVDRGRLTNYLWGFLGCATWLWVAVMNHLVGDIFSQIFYVIMQFVGVYVWQRQLDRQQAAGSDSSAVGSAEVKARNITWWQGLLAVVFTVAVYLIVVFTSHATGGVQIWLDGTLLPLGIIGQVLMTYGYRSQWIAWLLLDVIKVVIWWNQLAAGGPGAMSMFVLQVVMLVNGFYGTWVWFHKDSVSAAAERADAQSAQQSRSVAAAKA
ncbi:nicotinamide riboside transporter PnuC [Bifidobacterium amazonense]|uniref:Nicotinamide riboside transporter PnuC n=1 Tax=Bifidobacterium amazonense TaxID=2809027 RepID=A0ABS9VXI0_9BIFI|nr:nicotinamide riboside transporter PnuC [Bifidobacterium amazonense]MCH9276825.1 nicotinamide riboside transporter PnuC [Bifidobacterium amazonense]